MRIHVTGASGYLGGALLRAAPDASRERVEVRNRIAVRELLTRVRPDVVIHTAYRQDGPDARAIVVEGTANVADEARRVGAHLVHLSTDVVFDGREGAPYDEDDTPHPVTAYGEAKAAAEGSATDRHPDALVVRTSLILGGPGVASSKHERAAWDPTMTFYDDEVRSPIQVDDLAAALLELADLAVSGVLHVAGADPLSRAELAALIVGRPVRSAPAPPGRPLDCSLDSSRARGILRTDLRGARTFLS
jgi:dTDP-4-dehydrorhamnose reductase